MDTRTRWLIAIAGLAHLTIGVPEVLNIGPRFLPASWQIIKDFMPNELDLGYPALFVIAGGATLVGALYSSKLAAIGLNVSSVAFAIWGCVSAYGWATNQGGTVPGTIEHFLLAGSEFLVARHIFYVIKNESNTDARIDRLEELTKE